MEIYISDWDYCFGLSYADSCPLLLVLFFLKILYFLYFVYTHSAGYCWRGRGSFFLSSRFWIWGNVSFKLSNALSFVFFLHSLFFPSLKTIFYSLSVLASGSRMEDFSFMQSNGPVRVFDGMTYYVRGGQTKFVNPELQKMNHIVICNHWT